MDGSGKATHENVAGVRLYRGLPGKGTGHAVYEQSYFDRFWEQGAHTIASSWSSRKTNKNRLV